MRQKNQNKSALRGVLGDKRASEITAIPTTHVLSSSNQPSLSGGHTNRRSVSIQKDRILEAYSPEESFEIVVEKIANLIDRSRKDLENALIASGAPKTVRQLDRKKFNAAVQNKLSENNAQGDTFRKYMTLLVTHNYGKSLVNDGFFRKPMPANGKTAGKEVVEKYRNNDRLSANGMTSYEALQFYMQNAPGSQSEQGNSEVTGLKETPDGGVKQTKKDTDWGSILSGSAQVINSVGGVIGLFTNGNQSTWDSNVFNTYSQFDYQQQQMDFERERRRKVTWLVVGIMLVAIAIATVVYFVRKAKSEH